MKPWAWTRKELTTTETTMPATAPGNTGGMRVPPSQPQPPRQPRRRDDDAASGGQGASARRSPTTAAEPEWVVERAFRRTPDQVGPARRWAASVYADAGADPEACRLLVSEAATNAVVHASGDSFRVRIHTKELWVEVWDDSPALPRREVAGEDSEGGRGLELMELLAPGYQVAIAGQGKALRFQPTCR